MDLSPRIWKGGILRAAEERCLATTFRQPREAPVPGGIFVTEIPAFVDRKSETDHLKNAILKRTSLMICGPAGIGKTALVSKVMESLPAGISRRCLQIHGAKDLRDLLHQLIQRLGDACDLNLRRKLRSEEVSRRSFAASLKRLPTSRMKGTLYRTLEGSDCCVFLDHLPPLTKAVAKVVKEMFWMRNTPVYWLVRDDAEQRIDQLSRFFYWGDSERITLQPLPTPAAVELLENCIEQFGLAQFDLTGFRRDVLDLSKQIPGAIVRMCKLAADPRYQYESRIKIKSVYIDYLMTSGPAPHAHSARM